MKRFDTLLACPCCGGQAVALVQRAGRDFTVRVECSDCHIATPGIVYARAGGYLAKGHCIDLGLALDLRQAREEAAALWNRRDG